MVEMRSGFPHLGECHPEGVYQRKWQLWCDGACDGRARIPGLFHDLALRGSHQVLSLSLPLYLTEVKGSILIQHSKREVGKEREGTHEVGSQF